MSKPRNNVLGQIELCKLVQHLEKIKDDLLKAKPQCSKVAEQLTKDLGFTITKRNILSLIRNGICPDFRPPSNSQCHFSQSRSSQEFKLTQEVEALRRIVEEQGKRIYNLEIELGIERLEARMTPMNGKHAKAM